MTPKVPLLSERLRSRVATLREPPYNDIRTSLANYLESVEAEVAALERQLERGVEGLVPEGWQCWHLTLFGGVWDASIEHRVTGKGVHGTGPTVEAAVKNASEKVTK